MTSAQSSSEPRGTRKSPPKPGSRLHRMVYLARIKSLKDLYSVVSSRAPLRTAKKALSLRDLTELSEKVLRVYPYRSTLREVESLVEELLDKEIPEWEGLDWDSLVISFDSDLTTVEPTYDLKMCSSHV